MSPFLASPPQSQPPLALFLHTPRTDMVSSTPSLSEAPSSPLSEPPSSPLTDLGRTPSPPLDYPSPPVSNVSEQENSRAIRVATPDRLDCDGPPPTKKRKVCEQKPRSMERLDLHKLGEHSDRAQSDHQNQQLKRLVATLRGKRKIVVVAGAGISVSAGIPDFRSATGLFTTLRSQHKLKSSGKELFDASVYKNDHSTTSFHSMVRELSHLTQKAEPTPFHHMLASIADNGRLMRLYTQNVDGIDTALKPLATRVPLNAKGPWPKCVQLHGGLEKMVCSKCGTLSDFDGPLFEGPEAPSCPACIEMDEVRLAGGLRSHGIGCLRPRMVLYNEFNPDSDAIGNVSHADLKTRPDAVIVVGTSLKVPGIRRLVKELCAVTRSRRGGFTAWINVDEPAPEFKDCWDMVVRAESDEVARHVNLPRWDDKDHENFSLVLSDEEREMKTRSSQAMVEVPSVEVSESELDNVKPPKVKTTPLVLIKQTMGIPTPAASPRKQSPSQLDAFSKMKQAPAKSSAKVKSTHSNSKARTALPTTKPKVTKKKAAPKAKKIVEAKNSIKTSLKTSKSTSSSVPTSKPKPAEPLLHNFSTHFIPRSSPKIEPNSTPKVKSDIEALLCSIPHPYPKKELIKPCPQRPNGDCYTTSNAMDDSLNSINSFHTAVQTPSPSRRVSYDRNATISPKSMPSGMEGLIDP